MVAVCALRVKTAQVQQSDENAEERGSFLVLVCQTGKISVTTHPPADSHAQHFRSRTIHSFHPVTFQGQVEGAMTELLSSGVSFDAINTVWIWLYLQTSDKLTEQKVYFSRVMSDYKPPVHL